MKPDSPIYRCAYVARSGRRLSERVLHVALAFALLFAAVAPDVLEGQPDFDGQVIQEIEVSGNHTLSEETVLYYLDLAKGKKLDAEALNQSIKNLWSRNLIDDVKVDATAVAGGVKLSLTVVERPVLRSIQYEGLKRLSRTDIDDKISAQGIQVHEGGPVSLGELQRLKALIEDMYKEKGYRFAEAKVTLEDAGGGEKRAVLTIDEGDRVRIGDIQFEGNTVFSDARLRWSMKKTKESGIIASVLKKDIYNPATLQEDLDSVRKLYKADGYKNVVIGEPRIDVVAKRPNAPTPEASKRRLVLTIPIEEGERWKFGAVSIDGNQKYADEVLLKAFRHRPGDWLRSDVIDKGVEAISDLYRNSGYIFARVEPELKEQPGDVADVLIHIAENDQFKVARIEFSGNTRTRDKVLRRELRVQEGFFVNIGAVKNSIYKINQLGYFKLDQDDPVGFDPNVEKKTVDLTFKGEESDRTEVQFGAGYSGLDGYFGQVAVRTKNFLGRGESVGVSLQSGAQRDIYDISYFVPWFLDKPQTVGLQAFRQSYTFNPLADQQFQQESRGGILTYGRNFGLFQSASISYNLSDNTQTISVLDANGQTVLQTLKIQNSSLRPTYLYDSIDSRFEPTVGQRLRVSAEYAGGPLGGQNYFVRPEIGYTYFHPVSVYPVRTVFGLNAEVGWVRPFGGRALSPFETYFLGGENSIRGHHFRSIFVRDPKTNLPVPDPTLPGVNLGGDKYAQINLEYHFLTSGPIRIVAFVDGANVYGAGQSIDLSRLRYTTGAELRLLVPVLGAPLRFIYAYNLDPLPDDRFESFNFTIGTSF